MKIILQQEVINLGRVGDQVVVRSGFGRNYLIPQGKAVRATKENLALFELKRAEFEKQADQVLEAAKKRSELFQDKEFTITSKAGEGGKLFGSVGPRDIAKAIENEGFEIEKSEVSMPDGPIRQTGDFDITLKLHSSVAATVKIKVIEE